VAELICTVYPEHNLLSAVQFVTVSPGVYSRAEIETFTNININILKDNLITPDKKAA